ncbi:MAG: hypothetical protein KIS66_03040 [Fimbriimonadaceae bacterium]|nr:hypothetical protein [Fimbriimonadaceae bacterium]
MPLALAVWLAMNLASSEPVTIRGLLDVEVDGGRFRVTSANALTVLRGTLFDVEVGGRWLGPSDFRVVASPQVEPGEATPSYRPGRAKRARTVRATYAGHGLSIVVRLRTYADQDILRPEIRLTATEPVRVDAVRLGLTMPGAKVLGVDDGNPLANEAFFASIEHPMAVSTVAGERASSELRLDADLVTGESIVVDSVIGAHAIGQRRRAFQTYLEAFRAQPRRYYLHPNCWFDLGFPTRPPFTEAEVLDRMAAFRRELTERRGVALDGYVLDDPWDDPDSLWGFPKSRFPDEWSNLAARAKQYGWTLGVWMSPFGGYGENQIRRVRYGKAQSPPFETQVVNGYEGFRLAGPHYYRRFRDVALDLMQRYGVGAFKFDGIGGGLYQRGPNPQAVADYRALFRLTQDLRSRDPKVFINATVGTWHSPFWLFYVDSIWRDGEDTLSAGNGPSRERWITYRDGNWHKSGVRESPLFPVSCVMLVGPTLAEHAPHGLDAPLATLADLRSFLAEVYSFFGMGVTLQELYLTPRLVTPAAWDGLARAVKWARTHRPTLMDAHWVGGDPLRGEVYGTAAWRNGRVTLMLRNPSEEVRRFALDADAAFELPPGAARRYRLKPDLSTHAPNEIVLGPRGVVVELAPFEVSVWSGGAERT